MMTRTFLVCAVVIHLTACGMQASGGSRSTTRHLLDAGTLSGPLNLTKQVEYRNATPVPIVIAAVKTSCACFTATPNRALPASLAPGESLTMECKINAPDVEGAFRYSASLLSTGDKLVHVETVFGVVVPVTRCVPRDITIVSPSSGQTTLFVSSAAGEPRVSQSPEWVKVRLHRLRDNVWRVECHATSPLPMTGALVISCGTQEKVLVVPIRNVPPGILSISPQLIVRLPRTGVAELLLPVCLETPTCEIAPGISIASDANATKLVIDASAKPGVYRHKALQKSDAAILGEAPYTINLTVREP